jgi:hypothetical protein
MPQREEACIGIRGAHEGEADGQAVHETERHGEVRITSDGRRGAGDALVRIAMREINHAHGIVRGADQGVELVGLERGIDALGSGELACALTRCGPCGDDLRKNAWHVKFEELQAKCEVIEDLGPDLAKYTQVWDQVKAAQ